MKFNGSIIHGTTIIMILSRMAVTTRAFVYYRPQSWRRPTIAFGRTARWATGSSSSQETSLSMENLYKEWTLHEDETLWKYRNESADQLASRLG